MISSDNIDVDFSNKVLFFIFPLYFILSRVKQDDAAYIRFTMHGSMNCVFFSME